MTKQDTNKAAAAKAARANSKANKEAAKQLAAQMAAQMANANEGDSEEAEAATEEASALRFGTGKLRHASIAHYRAHEVAGRRVFDCGDATAVRVRTMTVDELYEAASKHTGISEAELRQRYAKLNAGMVAMNLRNRLRASA